MVAISNMPLVLVTVYSIVFCGRGADCVCSIATPGLLHCMQHMSDATAQTLES